MHPDLSVTARQDPLCPVGGLGGWGCFPRNHAMGTLFSCRWGFWHPSAPLWLSCQHQAQREFEELSSGLLSSCFPSDLLIPTQILIGRKSVPQ